LNMIYYHAFLGLEWWLAMARWCIWAAKFLDAPGYHLMGFLSFGRTLGIATKIILRIVKRPDAADAAGGFSFHQ